MTNFFERKLGNFIKFIICFMIILAVIHLNTEDTLTYEFYWDSGNYYQLATSFIETGSFDLYDYPLTIRGYVFPILILICRQIFNLFLENDFYAIVVGLGLIYAYFINYVYPYVFSRVFKNKMPWYFSIVITLLIGIFWKGFYLYPLSDLFGYSLLILSVGCFYKIKESNDCMKCKVLYSILFGLSGYALYSARSSIALITVFILLGGILIIQRKPKQMLVVLIGAFIGCSVIATPQALLNDFYGKGYNYMLHSDNYEGQGDNLIVFQLKKGITYIKYDTLVEEAAIVYGKDALIEYSHSGVTLETSGKIAQVETITDYIKLVFENPKTFFIVYMEHFEAFLDARYGEIYIKDYDSDRSGLLYSNYLIWILSAIYACVMIRTNYKKKGWKKTIFNESSFIILVLLLNAIVSFPGVPEYRFFFPVYILVYTVFILLIEKASYMLKNR